MPNPGETPHLCLHKRVDRCRGAHAAGDEGGGSRGCVGASREPHCGRRTGLTSLLSLPGKRAARDSLPLVEAGLACRIAHARRALSQ